MDAISQTVKTGDLWKNSDGFDIHRILSCKPSRWWMKTGLVWLKWCEGWRWPRKSGKLDDDLAQG